MKRGVIFFDFFGVICSEIAPVWLEKYYDKQSAAQIKASIFPLADIGDIDEDETFARLSHVTNIPIERIKSEWQDLIIINSDVVDLIQSLRTSNAVYLLSNAISSFLMDILSKNNLYSLFDKIYISSEINIIKPNKEFFEYVLNDLGLAATDVIMIDDNPDNIKGAHAAGIKGIVYTNVKALIEALHDLDIHVNAL